MSPLRRTPGQTRPDTCTDPRSAGRRPKQDQPFPRSGRMASCTSRAAVAASPKAFVTIGSSGSSRPWAAHCWTAAQAVYRRHRRSGARLKVSVVALGQVYAQEFGEPVIPARRPQSLGGVEVGRRQRAQHAHPVVLVGDEPVEDLDRGLGHRSGDVIPLGQPPLHGGQMFVDGVVKVLRSGRTRRPYVGRRGRGKPGRGACARGPCRRDVDQRYLHGSVMARPVPRRGLDGRCCRSAWEDAVRRPGRAAGRVLRPARPSRARTRATRRQQRCWGGSRSSVVCRLPA
ncbi:MAG: hypothetical protein QOF84_1399 [Streptomyces sp.]|nr:hypothetical protein [Streptomyces sp.]